LYAVQYLFVIISRSVILTVRNVSDKRFRKNQNKRFKLNNLSGKGAVYEKMWKNMEAPNR